jgi:uncharacterized protein (DUF952 family)
LDVANRFYRDVPGDFLVLVIDPARLTAPLRDEPASPGDAVGRWRDLTSGHLFPHIYGPLNRDAIVEVRPAGRSPDGTFLSV